MLMERGYGVMPAEWVVKETMSPGFSRIYFLEKGEVWYEDSVSTKRLRPGHLYIFPSHAPFSIWHNPQSPIGCLWCHMDLFPTMVTELVEVPIHSNPELYHLSAAFYYAVVHTREEEPYQQALANTLVAFFYKEGVFAQPDPKAAGWIRYIRDHCTDNTSIEEISRQFGYTPEHFIRIYHEKVGMSPCQYRIHCRLNLAIGLLKSSLSITDIAKKVGYSELKSFSRAFKGHFGMSPEQYRKRDFSRA